MAFEPVFKPEHPKTWRDYEEHHPELVEEHKKRLERRKREKDLINHNLSLSVEKARERRDNV